MAIVDNGDDDSDDGGDAGNGGNGRPIVPIPTVPTPTPIVVDYGAEMASLAAMLTRGGVIMDIARQDLAAIVDFSPDGEANELMREAHANARTSCADLMKEYNDFIRKLPAESAYTDIGPRLIKQIRIRMNDDITSLFKSFDQLVTQFREKQGQIELLKQRNAKSEESLKEEIAAVTAELADVVAEHDKDVDARSDAVQKLEGELQDHKTEIANLEQDLANAKQDYATNDAIRGDKERALEDAITDLRSDISNSGKELVTAKEELRKALAVQASPAVDPKVSELKRELRTKEHELVRMTTQYELQKKRSDELVKELRQISAEKTALEIERNKLLAKIEVLKDELAVYAAKERDLNDQIADALAESRTNRDNLDKVRVEIDVADDQLAARALKLDKLQDEYSALAAENARLLALGDSTKGSRKKDREAHKKAMADLREELKVKMANAEQRYLVSKQAAEDNKKIYSDEMRKLQAELTAKHQAYEIGLKKLTDEKDSFHRELKLAKKEIATQKDNLEDAKKLATEDHENDTADLRIQKESLEKLVESVSAENGQYRDIVQQMNEQRAKDISEANGLRAAIATENANYAKLMDFTKEERMKQYKLDAQLYAHLVAKDYTVQMREEYGVNPSEEEIHHQMDLANSEWLNIQLAPKFNFGDFHIERKRDGKDWIREAYPSFSAVFRDLAQDALAKGPDKADYTIALEQELSSRSKDFLKQVAAYEPEQLKGLWLPVRTHLSRYFNSLRLGIPAPDIHNNIGYWDDVVAKEYVQDSNRFALIAYCMAAQRKESNALAEWESAVDAVARADADEDKMIVAMDEEVRNYSLAMLEEERKRLRDEYQGVSYVELLQADDLTRIFDAIKQHAEYQQQQATNDQQLSYFVDLVSSIVGYRDAMADAKSGNVAEPQDLKHNRAMFLMDQLKELHYTTNRQLPGLDSVGFWRDQYAAQGVAA